MSDLATLKGYLARAETNITEGELRLTRQTLRVEHLRVAGRDTRQAKILLKQMEQNLKAWHQSRTELLVSIARHEAANRP